MAQKQPFVFLGKEQLDKLSQSDRAAYIRRVTAELTRRGKELRELSRRNEKK
jgi:hypothetical protein